MNKTNKELRNEIAQLKAALRTAQKAVARLQAQQFSERAYQKAREAQEHEPMYVLRTNFGPWGNSKT